ncbi:hypothetical protein V8B97DRAFT_817463 [Scleroderma yunnanense]
MSSYLRWPLGRTSTPATKTKPLSPKITDDHALPTPHPDWETVNAIPISPSSPSASAEDHDTEFVSLPEGGMDGGQSHLHLHSSQKENVLPQRRADPRGAQYKAGMDRDNRQGRAYEQSRAFVAMGGLQDGFLGDVAALKEENDQLKAIVRGHVKQVEETGRQHAQCQNDLERLKAEKTAADRTSKAEIEKLKATQQQQARQMDAMSSERDRMRRDRDAAVVSLTAENDRLKATLAKQSEEFRGAIEEINRDRAQAQSELQKARKSLEKYAAEMNANVSHINVLRQENKDLRAKGDRSLDLQRRFDIQAKDLKAARDESSVLRKEYSQMVALLDDRTSELKGAQSFLTTADSFSGTEVLSTLQRLNAEVLQNTAFMAESMIEMFISEKSSPKAEEQTAGARRAAGVIGRSIAHFLGTKKHQDDPVLVQIAFQAYFAYVLQWITRAWIIGGDEVQNRFIDGIYEKVRDSEAQAISGRWRALTRANIPQGQRDDLQLSSLLTSKILSGLADILLAAGCNASQSELVSALSVKFGDKVSFLVAQAIRVNKIIGEDVTSGDLEILTIPPATVFDNLSMEDVYNEGVLTHSGGARVLCTTDLGLLKRVRVGTTGEKERQWAVTTLLKPKVALESVVDIMDD